jgi:hypothetical protein
LTFYVFYIFIIIQINIMNKEKEKQKDVVWPIRMSQELKNQFKKYCDNNGYSMNKLIKILIEKEIKNGK